jgi:hypothetical protein
MQRYMTWVSALLLAGLLVSCGGGGDSPSGGTTNGGTPPTTDGGTPPATDDGTPPTTGGGTLPSAGAHVEESDARVTLSGAWGPSNPRFGWSGGFARQSTVAGATASFTFVGTSVRWIGHRSTSAGIALVKVDGGPAIKVDLYAKPFQVRTPVLTLYGLSAGQHTLTIEVTGERDSRASSNVVVVDAFEVEPPIVSHLQESDPDATFTAGWLHDGSFRFSGGGIGTPEDPTVGGARITETAVETFTLKFRGTSIRWISYRGPDAGIARVQLDGGLPGEVDLYSPGQKFQEVVFTATGLADASHTLTIQATGRKNPASTAARIVVDAFDVTTPGRRYEQDNLAAITYTGNWTPDNVNRTWSEGMAAKGSRAGTRATFSFIGTAVSWIGCVKASLGRANVYLDGAFVKRLNTFRPDPIEGYQNVVFRAEGLTNGPHTLTVEAVDDGLVVVDAFDVQP